MCVVVFVCVRVILQYRNSNYYVLCTAVFLNVLRRLYLKNVSLAMCVIIVILVLCTYEGSPGCVRTAGRGYTRK